MLTLLDAVGADTQELGVDEPLDYRSQDFAEVYKDKPFDYIFDSIGGLPRPCLLIPCELQTAALLA